MRSSHIVLASILIACAVATGNLNYNQNSATELGCTVSGNQVLSPLNLSSATCAPFGTFNLNLTNVASQAPTASSVINNLILPISGSVEFNGTTYQTYAVAFHSPAENMIDGLQADLEMQIYLNSSSSEIAAVASFLFLAPSSPLNAQDNSTMGRQFALNQTSNQIITSLGSTWTLNLQNLANIINNKYQSDSFLNMYTFQSTLNFNDGSATCNPVTWFVYGGGLYVPQNVLTQFAQAIANQVSALQITANTSFANYAGNNLQPNQPTNSLQVTRLCFSGYFLVTMNSNYGLWFAWGLTVLFFVITLIMDEKPINNVDYVEDAWTHHPLVSVYKVGNNVFTRKSRCASILVQIINQFVWNAVFFSMNYTPGSTPNAANVIIFPLIATGIGWVVLYFIGVFLRMYYIKKSESESAEGDHREEHNDSAQFYIYIYYLLVVVLVCVGFSFTIAALDQVQSYNNPATANLWVAAVFVGLGLDWIIFDPIVCSVASSSDALKGLLRWKGLLYDRTCHETYLNALKRE